MSIKISMRHYLSIGHLSAAVLFADQCKESESTAQTTPLDSPQRRQHNACAISSLIVSAAFLEATINEIFSDCSDAHSNEQITSLPARALMASLWKKGIPRTASYSIIEKYEIALELNSKPAFNAGTSPYQDVKLLIELRNALIHYEPETIVGFSGHETPQQHKFEKRLKGKFPINPLTGLGNPFYPDKVLGAGCAQWAVRAAVAFTDDFFQRLGVIPTYEHVRSTYL
ncbi:hypothetical protein YS110_17815 [Acidovorax sp. YS12]|nr:hypothetical protein YS110_17815 [Acidovorax sp. YS12]